MSLWYHYNALEKTCLENMDCYFLSTWKKIQYFLNVSQDLIFQRCSTKFFLQICTLIIPYPVSKWHISRGRLIDRHIRLISWIVWTWRHIVRHHIGTKRIHVRDRLHWGWCHTPGITHCRRRWYRDNWRHFMDIHARTMLVHRILRDVWFHWWKPWI